MRRCLPADIVQSRGLMVRRIGRIPKIPPREASSSPAMPGLTSRALFEGSFFESRPCLPQETPTFRRKWLGHSLTDRLGRTDYWELQLPRRMGENNTTIALYSDRLSTPGALLRLRPSASLTMPRKGGCAPWFGAECDARFGSDIICADCCGPLALNELR